MKNYYEILNVSQNASQEEIKQSYRKLVKEYHPDKYANNPLAHLAEAKLKEINEAYDILGDPKKREKYDAHLSRFGNKGPSDNYSQQTTTHSPGPEYNRAQVYCSEHTDRLADGNCQYCNKPLCFECLSQFTIRACPDCLMEYNANYLASLRKPLVRTGIAAIIGLILGLSDGFPLQGLLFGIIIYWGWQEVKYAFEIGFFSALLTGPVGFFVAIVLGIVYVAIMGAIKAIINVPKLIYRYSKDYQAIKDAEEYILNLNQQRSTTS